MPSECTLVATHSTNWLSWAVVIANPVVFSLPSMLSGSTASNPFDAHIRNRVSSSDGAGVVRPRRADIEPLLSGPSIALAEQGRRELRRVGAPVLPRADVDVADHVRAERVKRRDCGRRGVEPVDVVRCRVDRVVHASGQLPVPGESSRWDPRASDAGTGASSNTSAGASNNASVLTPLRSASQRVRHDVPSSAPWLSYCPACT